MPHHAGLCAPRFFALRAWSFASVAVALSLTFASSARAADVNAAPSDYQNKVKTLVPGDTLHLAAGEYKLLSISSLNGTEAQPIVITGPDSGVAQFHADSGPCCNTVEITNSSYVTLRKITVNGHNTDGAFGVSAKKGVVHHITIEDSTFLDHGDSSNQQTVAISTKVSTWGWVIRRNRITRAGTGLYLGNSNGSNPFVGGLIEGNLIEDTMGYNMQIKYQKPRPAGEGLPTTPQTTIIRNNVFIKTDRPSPDGDRPNVLVGGFPESGDGSTDRYEIYGNFFYHNPRESLLQASGRVSIHDNVFVDVAGTAILLRNHDLPLKQAYVYDNTIYGAGTGIDFGSAAAQGDMVAGNLVFAGTPITGKITDQRDNVTDTVANAGSYVNAPSKTLGSMDFYPLPGKAQGSAIDMTKVAGDTDYAVDFNGTARGGFLFRGAYAGEGTNPGWTLADGFKSGGGGASPGGGGPDGGSGAGAPGSGGPGPGAGGGGDDAGGSGPGGADAADSGCGCRVGVAPGGLGGAAAYAGLALAIVARRRRRAA